MKNRILCFLGSVFLLCTLLSVMGLFNVNADPIVERIDVPITGYEGREYDCYCVLDGNNKYGSAEYVKYGDEYYANLFYSVPAEEGGQDSVSFWIQPGLLPAGTYTVTAEIRAIGLSTGDYLRMVYSDSVFTHIFNATDYAALPDGTAENTKQMTLSFTLNTESLATGVNFWFYHKYSKDLQCRIYSVKYVNSSNITVYRNDFFYPFEYEKSQSDGIYNLTAATYETRDYDCTVSAGSVQFVKTVENDTYARMFYSGKTYNTAGVSDSTGLWVQPGTLSVGTYRVDAEIEIKGLSTGDYFMFSYNGSEQSGECVKIYNLSDYNSLADSVSGKKVVSITFTLNDNFQFPAAFFWLYHKFSSEIECDIYGITYTAISASPAKTAYFKDFSEPFVIEDTTTVATAYGEFTSFYCAQGVAGTDPNGGTGNYVRRVNIDGTIDEYLELYNADSRYDTASLWVEPGKLAEGNYTFTATFEITDRINAQYLAVTVFNSGSVANATISADATLYSSLGGEWNRRIIEIPFTVGDGNSITSINLWFYHAKSDLRSMRIYNVSIDGSDFNEDFSGLVNVTRRITFKKDGETVSYIDVLRGYSVIDRVAEKSGYAFIGWRTSAGSLLYEGKKIFIDSDMDLNAVFIRFYTTEGASIKTTGTKGIRFISQINTADAAMIEDTYGLSYTLGTTLTSESIKVDGVLKPYDIPCVNYYSRGEEINGETYDRFTAVLTGFSDSNTDYYNFEIRAVGYIKITYDDGTVKTVSAYCGEYTRSIAYVANALMQDYKDVSGVDGYTVYYERIGDAEGEGKWFKTGYTSAELSYIENISGYYAG